MGPSQDRRVSFHLLTILTGQSHISKVVVLSQVSKAQLCHSYWPNISSEKYDEPLNNTTFHFKGVQKSGSPGVRDFGSPGVRESGSPGVRESGSPGLWEPRSPGVRESGSPGVRESRTLGAPESGSPGVRESGSP